MKETSVLSLLLSRNTNHNNQLASDDKIILQAIWKSEITKTKEVFGINKFSKLIMLKTIRQFNFLIRLWRNNMKIINKKSYIIDLNVNKIYIVCKIKEFAACNIEKKGFIT